MLVQAVHLWGVTVVYFAMPVLELHEDLDQLKGEA